MKTLCTWMIVLFFVGIVSPISGEEIHSVAWLRQSNITSSDRAYSVAVDKLGNLYVTGVVESDLNGGVMNSDCFLSKYDISGHLVWSRQFGTPAYNYSRSVAIGADGNIFVAGGTFDSQGYLQFGDSGAFLIKYDTMGDVLWSQQVGSLNGSLCASYGVAADKFGNTYITGAKSSNDAFLVKYDNSGNYLWDRQIGGDNLTESKSVAVDNAGNIYIAGYTQGNLGGSAGGSDILVAKYDSSGERLWLRQIGSNGWDAAYSIAVDNSNNVYVAGNTNGVVGDNKIGGHDLFLLKYNEMGELLWKQQTGTNEVESAYGVAVDLFGNAYVTGTTTGSLGSTNLGSGDIFLIKYNPEGKILAMEQLGTQYSDEGRSVTIDGSGHVYISGGTNGSLDGGIKSGRDADMFLVSYSQPEPATFALLVMGSFVTIFRRKYKK